MEIALFKEIISSFDTVGFGLIVGGVAIFLIMKFFFPNYVKEKAKNLATKEDIGGITREVELIRSLYSSSLEELKASHQIQFDSIKRERDIKKKHILSLLDALFSG
ncbi:hypothetical protein [Dongshaea marina]|uniref:hypothetical protein n=1 Tax=Dongshaea marina TaxID=2047966 RepID=UPI000D3E52AB|nr:hypothetical protein [Dongshaea marina]